MRKSMMKLSLCIGLLASAAVSAQTFSNPGEVRVDDPKGSVILLKDADRTAPAPVGKVHLRYFQGWNLATPAVKYPADASTFTPGPTMRAKVGSKVALVFINAINDKNFSYTRVTANGTSNTQYGCDQAANPAL